MKLRIFYFLRPLVERERRERGDEDGAVGVAGRGMAASSTTSRRRRARRRSAVTVILGPRPMSRREELTCQRLRNAVRLWTKMYTEMGWCDDNAGQPKGSCMLLHATCSHREVEPRFIRVWLQGPVLQDAAADSKRSYQPRTCQARRAPRRAPRRRPIADARCER